MSSLVPSSASMEAAQPKRVVVCGGGVIGVCTAYFLSKRGARVILVEKSSIACAASGKAGGFLAQDWCDGGPLSDLARASFDLHRSLAEELDGPRSYGYRPLTALSVRVDESPSSVLSRDRCSPALPSWVDGPAKGPKTIGRMDSTAQVHPLLFTRTLWSRAVEQHGAELVIGKLEKVAVEGGRAVAVVLEGGKEIAADAVVLALGPWSSKLGILSSVFRVYGLKAHSIVLEPKERDKITPHALFLSYYPAQSQDEEPIDPEVYPRPTGEVYVCGLSARAEVPDDPQEIHPDPESITTLKKVAGNVSSHLEAATVLAEQACFLPCTEEGVPAIGEVPGVEGLYVAAGHSCWGILNGPATGASLAELVLHGRSTLVDLSPFSVSRFSRLS